MKHQLSLQQTTLAPILLAVCLIPSTSFAAEWEIEIDSKNVVREADLSKILGGNVGFWYSRDQAERVVASDKMPMWQPGLLRIPGGSWGDEIYWNGNGVRDGKTFDRSKLIDTQWQIDYSGYKPGFRVGANGELSDFHGGMDTLAAHKFVRDCGSSALVTVNAGVGTPEMAAEWVRWANKVNDFKVKYWEIGNELEGKWELGHFLPGGGEMTADIYAERFVAFAKAMKAVDPTIKAGGPAASNDAIVFGDALLAKAGDLVDFISYHTYPVGGGTRDPAVMFQRADSIVGGIKKLREKLQKQIPGRADEIEIGITEWHVGVHEGQYTVNQISGPWCAKWIGRMIEAGVDFANIWDMFSTTKDGGHGVFSKDDQLTPRGAFWALALWNEQMSGTLLKNKISGESGLTAFAAKTGHGVSLMLINENPTDPAKVRAKVDSKAISGAIRGIELSTANYLWDEHARHAVWSYPPVERRVDLDTRGNFSVPPMTAMVVHLSGSEVPAARVAGLPKAKIIAPEKQQADVPFNAWVTLIDTKTGKPFVGAPQQVGIEVSGNLQIEAKQPLTLHRPARQITVTPTGGGIGEITVRAEGGEAKHSINLIEIKESSEVLWTFDRETDLDSAISSFVLQQDQGSIKIAMDQRKPGDIGRKNRLIEFKSLPEGNREGIGGIVLNAKTSPDFAASPGAKISIILQSKANHWIPVGHLPLSELSDQWTENKVRLSDLTHLEAMPEVYAYVIIVNSDEPMKGSLYLDDLGFLVRK